MNAIKDAMLKSFNPLVAIKVIAIDDKPITHILNDVLSDVKKRYEAILDEEENVIYLNRVIWR